MDLYFFIVMIGVSLNSSLSYSRIEKEGGSSKELIVVLKDKLFTSRS